jgi:hypothetical protein
MDGLGHHLQERFVVILKKIDGYKREKCELSFNSESEDCK